MPSTRTQRYLSNPSQKNYPIFVSISTYIKQLCKLFNSPRLPTAQTLNVNEIMGGKLHRKVRKSWNIYPRDNYVNMLHN